MADTMGELGLFYRLAEVAFIGGSLVPHGGHNPLEPAQLDTAIMLGPHTHNFAAIVRQLHAAGGCLDVADAAALSAAAARLLDDTALRGRVAAAARSVADGERHILDAVMAELSPYLERLTNGVAAADKSADARP